MQGRYIRLETLTKDHISDLWHHYSVDDSTPTWLPGKWPTRQEDFQDQMLGLAKDGKVALFALLGDPAFLNPQRKGSTQHASQHTEDQHPPRLEAMGFVAFGDIKPEHRTIEAGAVFGPRVRGTAAATESNYLYAISNEVIPRPIVKISVLSN